MERREQLELEERRKCLQNKGTGFSGGPADHDKGCNQKDKPTEGKTDGQHEDMGLEIRHE